MCKLFKNVISLGFSCAVAQDLERIGYRSCSLPFDWIISDLPAVIKMILSGFENWLPRGEIEQDPETEYKYCDRINGFAFYHDFKPSRAMEEQYDEIYQKYRRRIERFIACSKVPVLYIRLVRNQSEYDYIEANKEAINTFIKNLNGSSEIVYVISSKVKGNIQNGFYAEDIRHPIRSSKELLRYIKNNVEFAKVTICKNRMRYLKKQVVRTCDMRKRMELLFQGICKVKLACKRIIGTDGWNKVLLTGGYCKYRYSYPELSQEIEGNAQFKNIHTGARCFIIGNGPSLEQQDLSLLEKEYVFTCNQITRNPIFPSLKTNYHFWADPSFYNLDVQRPGDMEILKFMLQVNTGENRPICFLPQESCDFVNQLGLKEKLTIRYFAHRLELTEGFALPIDFSRFVPNFHSVVHYAVAMAIYMGFSEIYLLGCDCTNVVTTVNTRIRGGEGAEYAYKITAHEKERMKNRNAMVLMEEEMRSFYEVFRGYRILYEYCLKREIKLLNSTAGGILDCIPRKRYEALFERSSI